MEKIIEKLLIEYLIPSILMSFCLILLFDIVEGNAFDLYHNDKPLPFSNYGLFMLVVFSYMLNNALSSLFNYYSRFWYWGKVREYLIYRKLDLFKEPLLINLGIGLFSYIRYKKKYEAQIFVSHSDSIFIK